LLRAADGQDKDAKGRALEDLGELIFTAIPGVTLLAKRSRDVVLAQEIDLVLSGTAKRSVVSRISLM